MVMMCVGWFSLFPSKYGLGGGGSKGLGYIPGHFD
jgi:hypothetical protein